MSRSTERPPLLSRALREPTLHFVVLALALFSVNAVLRTVRARDVVEIDRGAVTARIAQIEATLGGRLTPEERGQVEADWVDTEILAREARARGLDRDPQVQSLLAEKMLDVLSADAIRPAPSELEAYYAQHPDRYTDPAMVTVDELVVGTSGPLPDGLRRQLELGADPDALASNVPLEGGELARMTRDDLVRIFGENTADLVEQAPAGVWVGPHVTVRGQHWFRVTERVEANRLPLESVLQQVRLDWVAENERARLAARVAELRARHSVVFIGQDPGS